MAEPDIDEFRRFHDLLTEHAPDGYAPWYFRVREGSKAPATRFGSWKSEEARLSLHQAVEWMQGGGNVGIAGTENDALVNVDIDDEDETTPDDLKDTLIARSRSRTGVHAWYFEASGEDIPNIPTDDAGEVRANWQYVVAPGSYVDTDPDDVPEGYEVQEGQQGGYYYETGGGGEEESGGEEGMSDDEKETMLFIERCSDSMMWYSDKVGETVPLAREETGCYWSREDAGYLNRVEKEDARIVEVELQ